MGKLLVVEPKCGKAILDKLSCKGIVALRGSCEYWYNYMEPDTWWEYFAERYCDLFPEILLTERWVRNPRTTLNRLGKQYGHLYNVQWNKRSLAAFNRVDDRAQAQWAYRGHRRAIKAELTASPPEDLSELIALCVLRELLLKNENEIKRLSKLNNKYYHARVDNKDMWKLWWDYGGNESLNELWAINPLSGKPIRKDSIKYKCLAQDGYFD